MNSEYKKNNAPKWPESVMGQAVFYLFSYKSQSYQTPFLIWFSSDFGAFLYIREGNYVSKSTKTWK